MIFCGRTFCGSRNSIDYTSTYIPNINKVKLQSGIYNNIYVSTKSSDSYSVDTNHSWDFYTALYAEFENDLLAGNVNFMMEQVDSILIKRRPINTNKWTTIFKIDIDSTDDFNFQELDKYVRTDVTYEYALIPVINGSEGGMNVNSIKCEFDGLFIMEKDVTYNTIIDIAMSSNKNRPYSVINTYSSKYPRVITNGNNNYYSGSVNAVFVKDSDGCYDWDYYNSREYRDNIMEFLCNGKPKILKHFDGRMYLISVVDNPSQNESVSNYYPTTTFNWIEIGDAEDAQDLYDNNLIDYNSRYTDA